MITNFFNYHTRQNMTKDELLEDVQIGNIVKIYTESNEIFTGKIVDFGESGLKIFILDTNKAKRIMYGRITEYDIEDAEELVDCKIIK